VTASAIGYSTCHDSVMFHVSRRLPLRVQPYFLTYLFRRKTNTRQRRYQNFLQNRNAFPFT